MVTVLPCASMRSLTCKSRASRSGESLSARQPGSEMHGYRALRLSPEREALLLDRKSTRLNSSHTVISYAVFCLKKQSNIIALDKHQAVDSRGPLDSVLAAPASSPRFRTLLLGPSAGVALIPTGADIIAVTSTFP